MATMGFRYPWKLIPSLLAEELSAFQPAQWSVESQLHWLSCSLLTLRSMVHCTAQQNTVLQSTECHSLNAQNNKALKTNMKHRPNSVTITIVNQYVKHEGNKNRYLCSYGNINPLNSELNPICHLMALLGVHHFLYVSRIRVKSLTLRLLMSCIYGVPILDVSRSNTTTQHSR